MVRRKSSKKILGNIYLILLFAFLYLPIILLILFSFNDSRLGSNWQGFTLKWYGAMFQDKTIMKSLKNTAIIALASAIISTIIGTFSTLGLYSLKPRFKKVMMSFAYIPMVNPDIVIGVSLLSLFSLIKGLKLGYLTLILAHTTFCMPYIIFSVLPKLSQLDPNLEEAALDLGATPKEAFLKVILPEIFPGIMSGFLMALTLSLDDFIVSFFNTGTGVSTLPIAVYSMTKRGISPEINALTTVMFIVLLTIMTINYIKSNPSEKDKQYS